MILAIFALTVCTAHCDSVIGEDDGSSVSGLYTIEGRVYAPEYLLPGSDSNWQQGTVVSINGGEFKGFLREDGSFVISSVPSGSYVVEVINPDYFYEPVSIFN